MLKLKKIDDNDLIERERAMQNTYELISFWTISKKLLYTKWMRSFCVKNTRVFVIIRRTATAFHFIRQNNL